MIVKSVIAGSSQFGLTESGVRRDLAWPGLAWPDLTRPPHHPQSGLGLMKQVSSHKAKADKDEL